MADRIRIAAKKTASPVLKAKGRRPLPRRYPDQIEPETASLAAEEPLGTSDQANQTSSSAPPALGHHFGQMAVWPSGSANVQAKRTMGQPNDRSEQAADPVADPIMRKAGLVSAEEQEPLQTKALAAPTLSLLQGKQLLAHELTPVVEQTETLRRESKEGEKKGNATPAKSGKCDSTKLHLTEDPPYCCECGKKLHSPTKAMEDYNAKTQGVKLSQKYVAEEDKDTEGPQNVVNCELADEVVEDLRKLLKAASTDGVEVKSKIGGRDLKGQWRVWHKAGHPKSNAYVAHPGTSNHGTGRAIDFENRPGSFDWLLKNAGNYGWVNYPKERWHYDHVSTTGIIAKHRKTAANKSTKRKKKIGGEAKTLTPEEKSALQSQYDTATVYVAVPWNQKRAYPRETWLKVQKYVGMQEKEHTGVADEATAKAVMAWQKNMGFEIDGKVGSGTLKALGVEAGWSGAVEGSINAQTTRQGKRIRRIPIEGLASVKATLPEDPKQVRNKELLLGRALMLVPDNVNGTDSVEVLIHLHGHTAGYKTATQKSKFGASIGGTEDIENDKIVQQLEASERKMIAALPQGTDKAQFNPQRGGFDSDAFIQEALLRTVRLLGWAKAPTISRTVLAGFSGGGDTIRSMLSEKGQPRAPSALGELILFDAIHGQGAKTIYQFLEEKLANDLAGIQKAPNEAEKLKYIALRGFRFRGITTGKSGYGPRYQSLADMLYSKGGKKKAGWFTRHAADLGGEDSPVYNALRANYQVIFSKNEEHGTLMGDTKEPNAKGHLEEALRAGPPQK